MNKNLIANSMSEAELQSNVIELAHTLGYLCHAERPAQNTKGQWRTAIQGDKGFPDLVMTKHTSIIIVELKSEKGRLSQMQSLWLNHFGALTPYNASLSVRIWRPSDWLDGTIEKELMTPCPGAMKGTG